MARQRLMPPFAYYGGKTTLAPVIADLLPAHEHYVEPFAGSLAVLLAKAPSRAETVNDKDGDLVTFWRVLRDRGDELARVASLTPHSREEYRIASGELPPDELERARLVWVRLTQGRSHSMRPSGWWYRKAPAGHPPADHVESYAVRLAETVNRLRCVTLEARDALDLIRDYGSEPTVCLYLDPPYLGSTRATNYGVEMTGDDAHGVLADALNSCKASVVLSGYAAPLYEELFTGWHRTELAGATTLSGATDRVEVLWSNRELGQQPSLFGESA